MDKNEKIINLLEQIRDAQARHIEEWTRARDESLEVQKSVNKIIKRLLPGGLGLMVLIYFSPNILEYFETRRALRNQSYIQTREHFEAKAWLQNTDNDGVSFASNRFRKPGEALSFVQSVYDAGADAVYVVDITPAHKIDKINVKPSSDSLVAVLPVDDSERDAVFKIYELETQREGFDPVPDVGQRELYFWWD